MWLENVTKIDGPVRSYSCLSTIPKLHADPLPGSISEAASHDGRVGVQLTGWMEAQNHRHHPQGIVTSRSSRPMRSHRRPLDTTLTRPAIIPLILAVSKPWRAQGHSGAKLLATGCLIGGASGERPASERLKWGDFRGCARAEAALCTSFVRSQEARLGPSGGVTCSRAPKAHSRSRKGRPTTVAEGLGELVPELVVPEPASQASAATLLVGEIAPRSRHSFLSSDPDARVACNACPPRHVIFGQARPLASDAPPAAS
jgi:hypothetical protein